MQFCFSRYILNIVTSDETWVHYVKPVRKLGYKLWLTKHSGRSVVAKRTINMKKVLMSFR